MGKPSFQAMSRKDLHSYVLDHRDEQEAFYAYVYRLHQEENWIEMSAVESIQDLEQYPEFTAQFRTESEPMDN
jgi:hypothetical protein